MCFKKHYKIGFLKGVYFLKDQNNCLLIGNFENSKNGFVATNSV